MKFMGQGNDLFFNSFIVIFFIIFALILGLFVVGILGGIKQWKINNNSPVLTVEAKIVAKRMKVRSSSSSLNDDNTMFTNSSSTDYYITFEFESGDRLEFEVPGDEYGILVEGDLGKLTFQGTRYKGFTRK
ncbi:DUF2500 domain-containing protein [Anaerosporobacter sp.]